MVGRVVRPRRVRGSCRSRCSRTRPNSSRPGPSWASAAGRPEPLQPAVIRAARLHLGRLLLSLEGVEDRDAADQYRGAWLSIPVASARPGPRRVLAWLVGLTVVDHQGREQGQVADIVPGARDLLAVELPSGTSALVPAVAALVTVELEAGQVLVDAVPRASWTRPDPVLVDIVTIFPGFFESPLATGLLGKAEGEALSSHPHDLRDWAGDRHRSVDDAPSAAAPAWSCSPGPGSTPGRPGGRRPGQVVLLAPDGRRFDHGVAQRLAAEAADPVLRPLRGHRRARPHPRHEVVSIGDFVLAGAPRTHLVVLDAVASVQGDGQRRLGHRRVVRGRPAVRGSPPAVYRGLEVPAVLRSGDHGAVERWRAPGPRGPAGSVPTCWTSRSSPDPNVLPSG